MLFDYSFSENEGVEFNDPASTAARQRDDAAVAFCDALQANMTLTDLIITNAHSLGGFHGRTLPVSLKTLNWEGCSNGVGDDATVTNLATAVCSTKLKHFESSVFGQLATRSAAAPTLAQLKSLVVVDRLDVNHTDALIAGLSRR
ncbi:hypothetical protein SPRG_09814 [Saprolegnia parasitica CBS 223.65]|uniref:Uncharacterized protein n=1 Tax=Saprolegnia parasitica (strain CBS 223.65) TaxID=695850 RepID=A0A067C0V0_SAPPC|nr:hypothetical protein SPRG_09814 [Saprolegnia parasitica CBS 223.65]KDO24424.1 hypothetical protein SPRG_09814 [Saprolegnia parasitica CBS 223.65]|eukprot:XP_012204854.1 hypothetical protein SPRG_09814 [Saprolegnia parasitica CBS 223.65]